MAITVHAPVADQAINADTQAVDYHVVWLLHALDGVAPTRPKGNTSSVVDENPNQNRLWKPIVTYGRRSRSTRATA